jgi:antitoxin PrlF
MSPKKDACNPEDLPCGISACRVEAVITVDERGQMVLPKDVREKAGIKTGEKLALISWERDGSICCLALIRVDNLNRMVQGVLGPLIGETGVTGDDRK